MSAPDVAVVARRLAKRNFVQLLDLIIAALLDVCLSMILLGKHVLFIVRGDVLIITVGRKSRYV